MNARDKILRDTDPQRGGEHAAQLRRDQAQVVEVHCDGEDKFVVIMQPDGELVSLREGDTLPASGKAETAWLPAKLAYYEDDNGRPGRLIPPGAVPFIGLHYWYCSESGPKGDRAYWIAIVKEEAP